MHSSTTVARALKGDEIRHSRYLDALHAFGLNTCLRMDAGDGTGGDGGGAGTNDGGQGGTGDQGGASGSGGQGGSGGQQESSDKGFPENTPLVQMTAEQQAAYWRHQAQKHEGRNRDLLAITGGKFGDDLKNIITEHSQLKQATLTDSEKAIETAKAQTRAELASENVRAAFDLVLPDDMPAEKKQDALEVLNLAAFLTPDGRVDTAKVKAHAATLAPAKDSGQQQRTRDWGGGKRHTAGAPLGSGGAAEAERRFGTKSTSTS
jgi:hypothetical protein